MRNIFFFDAMLTPKLIVFVYWLLLITAVVSGLGTIASGLVFFGLLTLVGGILGARIWCELLIVLFKMNEALQELRKK